MEFIELIDQAAVILQKKEMDDKYAVFRERYVKMRVYLENLRKAYVNKTLDNTRICLTIVQMIDQGDDDELQDVKETASLSIST